jgi:hypothetical protein
MKTPMETLTDAMSRLRRAGYVADFSATDDGRLACGACGITVAPDDLAIEEIVRFEGESNPDDQAILLAISCKGGCRGQYTAAYGPDTPPADAEVLRRLAGHARWPGA